MKCSRTPTYPSPTDIKSQQKPKPKPPPSTCPQKNKQYQYCGKFPPLDLQGAHPQTYSQPIDFDRIRKSQFTFAVRERGDINFIFIAADPDNPDCVIEIISSVVSGAKNEKSMPLRDSRGYVGFIINGKLVRNQKVTTNQYLESVSVNSSESAKIGRRIETNIPMISQNILTENRQSALPQIGRKAIKDTGIGSKLREHKSL